jgi:hypothetical protein
MWIVFGTGVTTRRVPGGLKVERRCAQCGETATFYEKEVTSTFRLYFVDVFDYQRHRVMACGCCSACYATDELDARKTPTLDASERAPLGDQLESAAARVGGYVERAASAVEAGVSSLFFDERPARPAPPPPREAPPSIVDEEMDDPLEDPLEARFRELERKVRIQIK